MDEIPEQLIDLKHIKIAPEASHQQAIVHQAIGRLLATWANVESQLIQLAGRLLNTTPENAFLTYYSFGAMRAREEYIEALVQNNLSASYKIRALDVLKRFKNLSRTRNEIAHSEYVLNTDTFYYVSTCYVSIDKITKAIKRNIKPINQARINELHNICDLLVVAGNDLLKLCRDIDASLSQEST